MRHYESVAVAALFNSVMVISPVKADSPAAHERSWTPAKQTDVAVEYENQLMQGRSPRPTDGPVGVFGRMDLAKRLDGYTLGPLTCGFVSSNGNSIACVSSTDTCAYESGYVGCCQPNQQCSKIKTKCFNYRQSRAGSCTSATDTHTVCCNSRTPECYTYRMTFSDGEGSTTGTYTALACSAAPGSGVLLDYDPSWSKTHSFPSSTSTTTSTTSQSPTSTTDEGDGGGGGSKTNVGAIAGGTVGGVAAIALVGLGAFLLLRKKKGNKNAPNTGNMPPVAPMTQQNSQGPYPPPNQAQGYAQPHAFQGYPPHEHQQQQQYDPRMSTFSQPQQQQNQYGQYPQQQQPVYQYGNNSPGFAISSTGSPPSHFTPSPHTANDAVSPNKDVASLVPHADQRGMQEPSELGAVNPLGYQSNRAELGGS